jgi:hypothetical protein
MSGAAQSIASVFSPAYMLFNALSGSNHDAFQLPSAEKIQQELAKQTPQSPAVSQTESKADQLVSLEQQRADRQRKDATQRQLLLETAARRPGYGIRSLFGSLGPRSSLLGSG